jgi:hypothetical protein
VVYETFRDSSAFSVCGFVVSDTNTFVLTDTNALVVSDTNTDGWFSLNTVCGSGNGVFFFGLVFADLHWHLRIGNWRKKGSEKVELVCSLKLLKLSNKEIEYLLVVTTKKHCQTHNGCQRRT